MGEPNKIAGKFVCDTVFDGDTIRVNGEGQSHIVRLAGVDAAEIDSPGADNRRSAFVSRIVLESMVLGRECHLFRDPKQTLHDRYGRFIAYAFRIVDFADVGGAMIGGGWASPWRDGVYAKKLGYENRFAIARQLKLGLWSQLPILMADPKTIDLPRARTRNRQLASVIMLESNPPREDESAALTEIGAPD